MALVHVAEYEEMYAYNELVETPSVPVESGAPLPVPPLNADPAGVMYQVVI
jgi:hypothetical protein